MCTFLLFGSSLNKIRCRKICVFMFKGNLMWVVQRLWLLWFVAGCYQAQCDRLHSLWSYRLLLFSKISNAKTRERHHETWSMNFSLLVSNFFLKGKQLIYKADICGSIFQTFSGCSFLIVRISQFVLYLVKWLSLSFGM